MFSAVERFLYLRDLFYYFDRFLGARAPLRIARVKKKHYGKSFKEAEAEVVPSSRSVKVQLKLS